MIITPDMISKYAPLILTEMGFTVSEIDAIKKAVDGYKSFSEAVNDDSFIELVRKLASQMEERNSVGDSVAQVRGIELNLF